MPAGVPRRAPAGGGSAEGMGRWGGGAGHRGASGSPRARLPAPRSNNTTNKARTGCLGAVAFGAAAAEGGRAAPDRADQGCPGWFRPGGSPPGVTTTANWELITCVASQATGVSFGGRLGFSDAGWGPTPGPILPWSSLPDSPCSRRLRRAAIQPHTSGPGPCVGVGSQLELSHAVAMVVHDPAGPAPESSGELQLYVDFTAESPVALQSLPVRPKGTPVYPPTEERGKACRRRGEGAGHPVTPRRPRRRPPPPSPCRPRRPRRPRRSSRRQTRPPPPPAARRAGPA